MAEERGEEWRFRDLFKKLPYTYHPFFLASCVWERAVSRMCLKHASICGIVSYLEEAIFFFLFFSTGVSV